MKKLCGLTIAILALGQLFAQNAVTSPQIRVSTDSLRFETPRFTSQTKNLMIYNDGDQSLDVSITDAPASPAKQTMQTNNAIHNLSFDLFKNLLLKKLTNADLEIPGIRPNQSAGSTILATAIEDSTGDVSTPGLDVQSVEIEEDFVSYTITINFAGPADTSAEALMSIDLDQNFATGSFPAPLGIGPVLYDVGSEYDILFDISGIIADTLNLPPIAIAAQIVDTTITPIGISLPLVFTGNSVKAQFLKALAQDFILDEKMNASLTVIPLETVDLPDFAPDFGHGVFGSEAGLGWLAEADTAGFSDFPLQKTVLPGDSLILNIIAAAVNPQAAYGAVINIANNSVNQPNLQVPVTLAINGVAQPAISVSPARISDTLSTNQADVPFELLISNSGSGDLFYFISDSLREGEDWLTLPGLPAGQVNSGESTVVPFSVNPANLSPNQLFSGVLRIISNDSDVPRITIPIDIFIQSPTGIDELTNIPQKLKLHPGYPNPFNPAVNITFDLPTASHVTLEIFNILGERVITLLSENRSAGRHSLQWNGQNTAGKFAGSNVYFIRLSAGHQLRTQKIILLK